MIKKLILKLFCYKYVANNKSKELHTLDCVWGELANDKTYFKEKELDSYLNNGYNGCSHCLRKYDTDKHKK